MNTKAVRTAAGFQLAQKDDLIANFLIGHMIIANARKFVFQLIQFMVVRGKQSFWLAIGLMQVFHDAPGNGNSIVSRSAAADFI